MKVDFEKIPFHDIEGREQVLNVKKDIGNALYMQGETIEVCKLGETIYFADGEIDIDDKEADIIKVFAKRYPYVAASAIENAITPKP